MLLLNLNKVRTAQERFEQVYEPGQLGRDPDFKVAAPVSLSEREVAAPVSLSEREAAAPAPASESTSKE